MLRTTGISACLMSRYRKKIKGIPPDNLQSEILTPCLSGRSTILRMRINWRVMRPMRRY